jgi:hypothetical protein
MPADLDDVAEANGPKTFSLIELTEEIASIVHDGTRHQFRTTCRKQPTQALAARVRAPPPRG